MSNFSTNERAVVNCYRSYYVTKPTTSYIVNSIIGCVVNFGLCIFGTFLNVLVVYIFWKTPKLRMKVSYFMIMVLSSNDILVTLIVHPAFIINSIAEMVEKASCAYKAFYHIATIVLALMSTTTFFVMNVERYLSIVHPIFHLKRVTKQRCLIVCFIFWFPTIFFTPVVYLLNLKVQILITILTTIVIVGTCYVYIAIFYVARKKRQTPKREVEKKNENSNAFVVENSSQTGTTASSDDTSDRHSSGMEVEEKDPGNDIVNQKVLQSDTAPEKPSKTISFLHDLLLAKISLLVVFCSFVLNFPNALVLALFQDRVYTVNGLVQVKVWTVTLVLINSTVNSLIFFWANMRLRKEGVKVCRRLLRR